MQFTLSKTIGLGVGVYLVSFLTSILVVSGLVWLIGWHITPLVLFMALLLALPVFKLVGTDRKETSTAIAISSVIIVLSTLVETLIYDVSYDGNAYHQLVIYALGHGWNPVYVHHNPVISDIWGINICIDHYPKGAETISAAFYSVTGNLDSGKALNLIFPIALSFILYNFFCERFIVGFSKRKSLLFSLGIAFSMITVGQITSLYIDHVGYFTFTLALIGVYCIIDRQGDGKFASWCLLCSIIIAAAAKFNMLFWVGFIVACTMIVLFVKKRGMLALRLGVASAVAAMVSVFVVAYNPLVTNTVDHNNPVYPLFGQGSTTDETLAIYIQPPYLIDSPRYKQVLLSYFQRPTNDITSERYSSPFRITRTNVYRSGFCATNIGGGGLFFIEIIIVTLIIFVLFRKGKYYKQFVLTALLLISTLLILPMGSNFRYVPFIYLLPFLALLYLETNEIHTKSSLLAGKLLAVLLFLNIFVCAVVTLGTNAIEQYVTMRTVKSLEGKGGESFFTANWGFFNKLYRGDMEGKEPIAPLFPEDWYEREKYIGGPFVYIIKPDAVPTTDE